MKFIIKMQIWDDLIKKKWTSNNKIIYPKSERQPKSKNKALSIGAICSRNSSFRNIKTFNSSLKSLLSNRWIISPKSAYSRKMISEKSLTVPAPISVLSHHKWSIRVLEKTLKEIDKFSKHKIHSILNLFANHSRKELIKAFQYKIPSEIHHHLSLKEVNAHMQAFCLLYTNKTIKWKVKAKENSAVIVKDQNALNFIVNVFKKKSFVIKTVTVMIVVTINKTLLSISRQSFKLLAVMLMALMLFKTSKKRRKFLNKKRLNLAWDFKFKRLKKGVNVVKPIVWKNIVNVIKVQFHVEFFVSVKIATIRHYTDKIITSWT